MSKEPSTLRPGLTAIAAVLALSTTPAFAQTADTTAQPIAASPVIIAPPAPTATPDAAPVATPTPTDTQTVEPQTESAPTPAPVATRSPLVIHQPDSATSQAGAVRADTVVRHTAQSAPVQPVTATRAASAETAPSSAAAPALVTLAPAPSPAVAVKQAEPVAPVPVAKANDDNTALIADLGAAAAIVLIGGAFSMGRRKRHEEEAEDAFAYDAEPICAVDVAPVTVARSFAAPTALAERGESRLPGGFDLSRFGPHTRAAYVGPTPDNPSLSLRKRLKRANFYDQRLRESGEMPEPMEEIVERDRTMTQSIFGSRLGDRLNFRPARTARPSLRPATA